MATRTATITIVANGLAIKSAWAGLLNTDVGDPQEFIEFADRSVQVTGTFGAGGAVVLEGSNDGTNYATLTDSTGTALSITAAGIKQITQITQFVRPRVTAGDGTTTLVATLLARRS